MVGGFWIGKQFIVHAHFSIYRLCCRYPMQDPFGFEPGSIRSGAAFGEISTVQFGNLPRCRVFLYGVTLDDISPFQAHHRTRCQAEKFLGRILHKVFLLDVDFARKRNHPIARIGVFRVVFQFHLFHLPFRVIGNHHFQGIEYGHGADGGLVQYFAYRKFQQAVFDGVVAFGHSGAFAEVDDAFGRITPAAHS